MDEDFIIQEERVNLLLNFFPQLSEPVIRDVLNRPDVCGDVQLASGVLGSLFDEPDIDVMNYGEYDLYLGEDRNYEDDKCGECVTGEPDEMYQEKEKEPPRRSEQLQEEEYVECLKQTKDKDEEEHFHARVNSDESIEPKSICMLSESRIKTEQDPPSPTKEKENINVSFPSSEVSLAKPKETLKETIFQGRHPKTDINSQSASKLQSDSEDEDIEKWFEQTYNNGNVTHTEKEERKIKPQIASLDEELCDVHQNSKPHPQNTKTKIHPETVAQQFKQPDQRKSFDTCDVAAPIKRATSQEKRAPILPNEEKSSSALNNEKDCKEQIKKPKHFLPQKPNATEALKENNCPEFQPSRAKTQQTEPFGKAASPCGTKPVTMETVNKSFKPKPKPRNSRQKGGKKSEVVSGRWNDQEQHIRSKQDQTRMSGDQRDLTTSISYETKGILVTGLSEKSTNDALLNYMELMTGEDVEKVTFLGKGRAVVDTSGLPDFEKLVKRVNSRTLDEMQLSVERIKACDSILVSGLSAQVTKDTIMLYFENVRRSGGGDVKDVVLHKDTNSAVVYFEDGRVVDNVIGKEHTLEGQQLSVEKYYPQLSSENAPSPTSEAMASRKDSPEAEQAKERKKRDVSPEDTRENVSTEVDADVMEFIMSSHHREDLEQKLSGFKAEIEWNLDSNTATIWKKANSGYVKKWANNCQAVCHEFLDRFEKFPVPVENVAALVIKDALPRLIKDLPLGKALCKQNTSKQGIEVVCLESEKEMLSETVNGFWEIIKKEEIRKTYKKNTEKVTRERLLLLEHIGFVEEMQSKHSELKIILDKEKCELYFEGPRDEFSDSRIRYFHIMNTITDQETYPLQSSTINGNFVRTEPVKRYFKEKLAREKINALFFVEDNVVKIVAVNPTESGKAKECLRESMSHESVSVQTQDAFIFKSERCQNLFTNLQKEGLLKICTETAKISVELYGMTEAVASAKREIERFVEIERIRGECRQISKGLVRFLSDHFSEKLKDVEMKLKQSHVRVQIDKAKGAITMSGTREGLGKCNEQLDRLFETIVKESEEYSSPGLAKLLLGENGLRNVKLIEMEKKVVIEMSKRAKDGVISTRQDEVDCFEREERFVMEEKKKYREETRQKSLDSQTVERVYDLCNFTTAEGVKVSWKYGNIAKEKANILVNSATSDLNKFTACGKALLRYGGQAFADACKPHTNVQAGDIICTNSGNLPAQFVIHAVCCHWDNNQGAAEQLLRDLVNKILTKCIEIGATTLAIPAIGTGQHKFPDNVVFKVFKEEIDLFSSSLNYRSNNCLQNIQVIVYKARPIPKNVSQPVHNVSRPVQNVSRPFQNVSQPFLQRTLSAVTPVVSNSRVVSFGSVCVTLHEGDITQQPASVDVMINVLPSSFQLRNGGGVCKSILNAGGQAIQQQLDTLVAQNPGSIVTTDAGSIQNSKFILHFIPTSTGLADLQRLIEDCLKQAQLLKLRSVSIPAIGTASFHISARDSADLILNAAKTFARFSYPLDLHIVVFQKNMVPDFEAVMQEQTKAYAAQTVLQTQVTQSTSKIASVRSHHIRRRVPRSPPRHVGLKTLKTGEAKEVIVLDLFASSQQDVDTSLEEVKKFIEQHSTTKEIEHEKVFDVLVKHWSEVEDLARDHDVSITCNKASSVAEIEGMVVNVSDCKDKLSLLITKHVEEERTANQVEFISKNVQWFYFEGSQSVPYDKELNAAIEMAYMENKETVDVIKNGDTCEIDLLGNVEKNQRSSQVATITRKQMGDSNTEIAVPSHWSQQPATQVVYLVPLQQSSQEYQQVTQHFSARGGVVNQFIKIERVQNPGLYKAYLVKKQSMNGAENEQQLFHGTSDVNIVPINANNFDRSFAGANGVVYGNGVYFARDASYSLRYAQGGHSGYRHMYVTKVLVGQSTIGRRGMKAPPARNDPSNPGLLFDSLVDNISNPSIFVIFNDHQCYPEYLITFT